MYHLLTGLYNELTRPKTHDILLLGISGAGKSTLLEILKRTYTGHGLALDKILPTLGQNVASLKYRAKGEGASGLFKFLDLGGAEEMRNSVWPLYYSEVNLVVYVSDGSVNAMEVYQELIGRVKCPVLLLSSKEQVVPGAMVWSKEKNEQEIMERISYELR